MTATAKPVLTSPTGKYGILDVQDNVWLGDESGPWRTDHLALAQLKADLDAVGLGWPRERVQVAEFGDEGTLRLHDEVPLPHWRERRRLIRAAASDTVPNPTAARRGRG